MNNSPNHDQFVILADVLKDNATVMQDLFHLRSLVHGALVSERGRRFRDFDVFHEVHLSLTPRCSAQLEKMPTNS